MRSGWRQCGGRLVGVGLTVGLVAGASVTGGCGGAAVRESVEGARPDAAAVASAASDSTRSTPAEVRSASGASDLAAEPPVEARAWEPLAPEVRAVFEAASPATGAAPVYVPTVVPAGTSLVSAPEPGMLEVGPSSDLRVLLKSGSGWLLIMEGMAGDLGDLPGDESGEIGGRPARAYRVLGGQLVQWSDHGVWYGVYGYGPTRDVVERVAQGMVPLDQGTDDWREELPDAG